ncbi:hypothetical protein PENTCL1PPCAC_28623, partial [Pristionchus entomophagus]
QMAPSTPKGPLHSPVHMRISGLQVQHDFNRNDVPFHPCTVIFEPNNAIVVRKHIGSTNRDERICSPGCLKIPYPDQFVEHGTFKVEIRHGCIEGWLFTFKCADRKILYTLLEALMRKVDDRLMTSDLLLEDRVAHLGVDDPTRRGLTKAQCDKMREETTPALPKGTSAQYKEYKDFRGRDDSTIRRVNACPSLSLCTIPKFHMDFDFVNEGKVHCNLGRGMMVVIDAADFYPPRIVTPPTSEKQIFVCDSRDIWNAQQAWVFEVKTADAEEMLDVLLHAWMQIEDSKSNKASSKTGNARTSGSRIDFSKAQPIKKVISKKNVNKAKPTIAAKAKAIKNVIKNSLNGASTPKKGTAKKGGKKLKSPVKPKPIKKVAKSIKKATKPIKKVVQKKIKAVPKNSKVVVKREGGTRTRSMAK